MTERRHLNVVPRGEGSPEPQPVDDGNLLLVGDLAKATGKTVRAIHLYEDLGLIEPAGRSKGRYRLFSPEAKVRVRWIGKLQSLGLSLTEIQAIVQQRASSESARRAAQELRVIYKNKLEQVRQSLRELAALESELEASVQFLETCESSCNQEHPATAHCASCTRHAEPSPEVPDLVVGARMN